VFRRRRHKTGLDPRRGLGSPPKRIRGGVLLVLVSVAVAGLRVLLLLPRGTIRLLRRLAAWGFQNTAQPWAANIVARA
jgi:hypothetical protein